MRVLMIAAGMVLGLAAVAPAAPVDLNSVPADAIWLAHLDVDAVKASTVVERVCHELIQRQPGTKHVLAAIRDRAGVDLTKDLQGITFYGNEIKKGAGVVIARATMNQALMLANVKRAPDYRVSTYGSHTLHTWTRDKGTHRQASLTGCFHSPSVLVLGSTAADAMAALDVLDGKLPSLAGSDSSLAAAVPEGTAVLVRAADLADAALPIKSPLVRQSKALSFVMGEHAEQVFAKATVIASSTETAGQMANVVEGLRALAILQSADQPEAVDLLRALQVETEGTTFTVAVETPAKDLWQRAERLRKEIEARRGGR